MYRLFEASRMLRAAYLELVKAAINEGATGYIMDEPQLEDNKNEEAAILHEEDKHENDLR